MTKIKGCASFSGSGSKVYFSISGEPFRISQDASGGVSVEMPRDSADDFIRMLCKASLLSRNIEPISQPIRNENVARWLEHD